MRAVLSTLVLLLTGNMAVALDFPTKPVTLVGPHALGSNSDVIGSTPQEIAAFYQAEHKRCGPLLKSLDLGASR